MSEAFDNRQHRAGAREPVAIVGVGCRLPGASNVQELWNLLDQGIDAVGQYPGGRFPLIDSVYAGGHPAGEVATRAGGFLPDVDKFDPAFFGISSREAAFLDPQHRLFLETAWEAIEDAGIVRGDLAGSLTGVFAGAWSSDYETCIREDAPETDFYSTVGSGRYSLSGRLSYVFDLRGPSLTIDAACSSSLAAIHMACRSIQAGDCEMALAGGSNLILRPDITIAYSAAGMLSRDGRCRFGDAEASGYVRSEGSAVIVLKSLASALADGNRIYAVIRGSSVNSDGSSSGSLIAPSRVAQTALIRAALADAGVSPAEIEYVEAHGPGTPAGDPVEMEAIGTAVADPRRTGPVLVGSIKTNIGHTEATAGVAGLIKTALALHHGKIPESLHFRTPNARIPWASLPVRVASGASAWSEGDRHLAAVSSFGITGTNACVILENAPGAAVVAAPQNPVHLLAISAASQEALQQAAGQWQTFLEHAPEGSLSDVCYTALRKRTHHSHRLAALAPDAQSMAGILGAWARGEQTSGILTGRVREVQSWKLGFVFSGVGGQWPGMCVSLLRDNPVFRERLLECSEAILRHGGPDIIAEIGASRETSRLAAAEIVQPAIWAVQLATLKLWESLGFQPQAVVGHSMGEVTAAVACGALSLEQGAAVICQRSRVSKQVSRAGGMALAGVNGETAADLIAPYHGRIWLAGLNGSESSILSGDADAIEEILADLNRREIFCRRIKSDVASHSPHMDEVRPELEVYLADLSPRDTPVEFYSTSTGLLERGSTLDAGYWGKNLRQPVLFWPTFQRMLADGCNAFVEIGPHPVLLHAMQETIREQGAEAVAVASLTRDSDEYTQTLAAVSGLHNAGYPVDFSRLYPSGRCLSLPAYPWQRERHWLEIREPQKRTEVPADHLYELHWKEIAEPARSAPAAAGFVVLGDSDLAVRLAEELRASGSHVFQASDHTTLRAVLEQGDTVSDVVHAVSTDNRSQDELDLKTLWQAQQSGAHSLIDTVQTLAQSGRAAAPKLWIVTAGALAADSLHRALRIEHSPVAGLAGAITREHPELACRHLDLSASATADDLRLAARILRNGTAEAAQAIQDGKASSPRYERSHNPAPEAPVLRSDASYLITGGLGGVGLEVAAWLAGRGAQHLVLAGRRAPLPEAAARISKLQSAGVEVRVVAADLTLDAETAGLISAIADMPPLRGIFHAAAVVDDALLTNVTPDQVARVLAPKMAGAWSLHRHTAGLSLDYFVLFSSIAVPVTQPGQGVYAAANSFLDAFAAWRRSQGLSAVSIQWGVWAETGLAKAAGTQRSAANYTARGIRSLSTELGLGILGAALSSDCACVLAAPISWKTFADSYTPDAPPRIFASLVPAQDTQAAQAPAAEQSFAARLEEVKPADRAQAVQEHLLEQLAAVLKTPASRIDIHKPLGTFGVDSLLALELVRRLSASTGLKLSATAVFNYPTVKALTAEIARRLSATAEPAPVTVAAAVGAAPLPAVTELSEEEAILALMTTSEPAK